jgi:MFS family permease
MLGCPLIGALSDYLALRKLPMIIFAAISLPVMLIIVYSPHLSLNVLLILFFALGLFTSSQTIAYPAISESNPKMLTGTALGLASVLIMSAPMVFEPFFGYLMDKSWDGKIVNGVHVYSAQTYYYSMLLLVGVLVVGLVFSFLIRETNAKDRFN